MAVVTGPLHSSEARGVVGGKTGLVYNTHRGRSYVKANATPVTQYSDPQVYTRAIMTFVIAKWQALEDADRVAWQDFASENRLCNWTGELVRLSGWNWFAKINFKLYQTGVGMRDHPPDDISAYLFDQLSIIIDGDSVLIYWQVADPPPDPFWNITIWRSHVHVPSVHPSLKMCKLYAVAAEQDGGWFDSTPPIGTYTYYLCLISSQGMTMPPARLTIDAPGPL